MIVSDWSRRSRKGLGGHEFCSNCIICARISSPVFKARGQSSITNRKWQPILRGDLARKADAVITTIARTLGKAERSLGPRQAYWHDAAPVELALFFGYLAAATGRPEHKEKAARFLQLAVQLFSAQEGLALYGGLCGLAWIIGHLERPPVKLDIDARELLESVDDHLLRLLRLPSWKGDYDVINGLVGYGVYSLTRLPEKTALSTLKLIVSHLDASAERSVDGISWLTPPRELTEEQRALTPQGFYNLGMAHGVPGVIGFLAEAYARGIERRRTLRLLHGTVAWVLAQKLPAGSSLLLPTWAAPGTVARPSRVAWCYGDLGASLAILNAARTAGRRDWEREALTLARTAARCPFRHSGTKDACLCHGAAGNGHLFNRLFQSTGAAEFRTAAELYFRKALELNGQRVRLGSYSFWIPGRSDNSLNWQANAGFLSGLVGVGLALLAATRPVEPGWDNLLLAVVRRPPGVVGDKVEGYSGVTTSFTCSARRGPCRPKPLTPPTRPSLSRSIGRATPARRALLQPMDRVLGMPDEPLNVPDRQRRSP
jgi:lantibiotic biosynthesis protein